MNAARVAARYTAMDTAERAEERAHQREVLNTATEAVVLDRAAARLDILDTVEGR